MAREVGNPIPVGGDVFKVGVSDRSPSGRLTATGTIEVTVPDAAFLDETTLRKQAKALALQMVAENPDLLTRVRVNDEVKRDTPQHEGDQTPWSDGTSKHLTEEGAEESSGILSPDTGQVNI